MVLICPWCLSISLLSPYGLIFKSLHYHREVSKHVSNTFLSLALTRTHRDDLKYNLRLFLLGGTCLPSSGVLSYPNPVPDAENRAEGALQEQYDWSFFRIFTQSPTKFIFFLHVLSSLFSPDSGQQQPSSAAAQTHSASDPGPIRATTPMWRCSRIMHMQRELHPTLLSSLEGIVDQMVWFRENWHEEVSGFTC